MIPRIIHQIWLGTAQPPEIFLDWHRQIVEMHPGWTVHFWTEENLPTILNLETWNNAKYYKGTLGVVMRADLLRLETVLRFGGIYLDMDMKPIRPLDPLLGRAFLALETPTLLSNAVFGFPKNHPLLWQMVNRVFVSFRKYTGVLRKTGPGFLTREFIKSQDAVMYPRSYFHRTPGNESFCFCEHRFGNTWVEGSRMQVRQADDKRPGIVANVDPKTKRFVIR